jgi:hypothetical protein
VIVELPSFSVRGSRDDGDLVPLHQPFEALRGFNRRQVLEHLESLDGRRAVYLLNAGAEDRRLPRTSR